MRLALFIPDLTAGGGERAMLALAQAFAAAGDNVELLLMRRRGALVNVVPNNIPVVDFQCVRMAAAVPSLAAYVRRQRPDVLLTTLFQANVAALLTRRWACAPTRVVIAVETVLSAGRCDVAPTLALRAAFRLLPRLLPAADRIVAVSEAVRRDLVQVFRAAPENVEVIFNPVIPADLPMRMSAVPEHPWLCAKTLPTVVAVGRLERCKDFDTLIRAVAAARDRRDLRLVIAGEGSERPRLEDLIKALGLQERVSLAGFVRNPFALYRAADAFASASRYEGFGNAIAEALACGLPVVAVDCPGGPAEILDGGKYGRLVSPGDSAALAEALLECLASRRTPAPAAWLERFTVTSVAERYRRVLEDVLT